MALRTASVRLKMHKFSYKENVVGEYIADILVEGNVIVEVKTVEKLDKVHEAQLLNYLKATRIRVGLLVNFKHPKAEIKSLPAIDLAPSAPQDLGKWAGSGEAGGDGSRFARRA